MHQLRIPIRVVFYEFEGDWVAHCLELDVLGHGATKTAAIEQLSEAIRLQVEASVEHDNPANLFQPADSRYFEMFAAGRDVAEPELTPEIEPIGPVTIESIAAREYVAADAVPV